MEKTTATLELKSATTLIKLWMARNPLAGEMQVATAALVALGAESLVPKPVLESFKQHVGGQAGACTVKVADIKRFIETAPKAAPDPSPETTEETSGG